MSRKKHKRDPPSTSPENETVEDGTSHDSKREVCALQEPCPLLQPVFLNHVIRTGGFMSVPIDVFKEITSYLDPGGILALARVNKPLRKLLMQRSAVHIWRRAERNVEMLPPCPSRFCEPQYAVLMFTKECSKCGIPVMRPMDIDLGVRLCNACRNVSLIDYSEIPSDIRPYVPISALIKKNSLYALRADVERAENELVKYSGHHSRQVYKHWKSKRKLEHKLWMKNASALVRYVNYDKLCRGAELRDRIIRRNDEIISRLKQHGWKPDHFAMLSQRRRGTWSALVNTDKPLTDRAWKRLYPKLKRLMKRNHENWLDLNRSTRQCLRYDRLDELLTEMRTNSCPYVEVAESRFSTPTGEQALLPFPSLLELRDYHVFKDLVETDRSVAAMVTKFHKCIQLVNNAIMKWRAAFEWELVKKVEEGRRAEKRQVPSAEMQLIEDTTAVSTKLTDSSYRYMSPKNSVLFRADTVFKFQNSSWTAHYPASFAHLADYMRKQFEEQVTGGSVIFKYDMLLPVLEYHSVGARVARALLAILGCPDAAYTEMNAPTMAYICGRCHYSLPQTWGMIIEHYVLDYTQWMSHSLWESQERHGIIFNNVHCLESRNPKPLIKLLSPEEFNNSRIRLYSSADQVVECNHCVRLRLEYVFRGSRKYVALHLRDVHSVSQPEYGEDYIEWRMLERDPSAGVFPIGELEM
ncbi:hypothetical protein FS749_016796 [Ceratobasidium sp. UAMH 11750]|nr:hypothetical protein FS749_016796 [Ceratobasidium sp. UAMH 11750]